MKELIYDGLHQEPGIVLAEDNAVDDLLATGNYIDPRKPVEKKEPEKKDVVTFNDSWTEVKIKDIIEKHDIPIDYDIANDTKKEIFAKLKSLGHIVV